MRIRLAIRTVLVGLITSCVTINAALAFDQLCWAAGMYDQTMYFAQAEVDSDRKGSFETLLSISGIDHHEPECVMVSQGDQRLTSLRKQWLEI